MANVKLSAITSGGAIAPSTDTLVAVRSGTSDVLVTPGTASAKAATDNTKSSLASVSGSITSGHLAAFGDTSGTILDGGAAGTLANLNAAPAGTLTGATLASNVLASSLTSVGTLTGGATGAGFTVALGTSTISGLLTGTNGGTGVNNGASTLTYGGNVTFSGAFTAALTVTANTTVTLPVTGTLATLAGSETFTNKTLTAPTISGAGTIDGMTLGATTPMQIQGFSPSNYQTGTSYTLVLGDSGKKVSMNNASASTLTVPPHSSVAFPAEAEIQVFQRGAGQVTVTAGAGVTINSYTSKIKTAGQYAGAVLKQTSTQDTWDLVGNLA